jgi:Ricin-type beta-trefoil lectin domain-like/G8 domain
MRTRFGLFTQLAGLTASLLLGCVETTDSDAPEDDALSHESESLVFQNGVYSVQAGHSGKCMAVAGASTDVGAKVVQASCSDALDRLWQLKHLGSDVYEIKAAHSGKCMTVKDGAPSNGAGIVQTNCNGSQPQRWKATRLADGKYTLVAQHSTRCLDVKAASTAENADVHQWTCGGDPLPHQRFQPRRLGSDLYDLSVQRALAAGAGLWSNPATWGGRVPAANARVTIPAGKTVVLDTDVNLRSLQVDGTLLCAARDLALGAGHIAVHGRLQCGAERAPFRDTTTRRPLLPRGGQSRLPCPSPRVAFSTWSRLQDTTSSISTGTDLRNLIVTKAFLQGVHGRLREHPRRGVSP